MTRSAHIFVAIPLALVAVTLGLAGKASAQIQLFEVEKGDATKMLQVQDDAGLVARGAFDIGAIPASGAGVRLMWYPRKAAFRAGRVLGSQWDDASVGQWSAAFGENTMATGTHSVAMNGGTTASADRSVAMGGGTTASGVFALSMGVNSVASGTASVAMGENPAASGRASAALGFFTKASGDFSTAVGREAVASGEASTASGYATLASGAYSMAAGFGTKATAERAFAMGDNTTAAGYGSVALGAFVTAGSGSFIFGDHSTNQVQSTGNNQFLVRAYGGIGFNSAPNIGCDLPPGSGAWACTSSRLAKEGFEDLDGESVLGKLAGIRIQRWNYIGNGFTHVGPTAEDFRSAFGLGESSTKIATVDADGIALRAIQALDRRTAASTEVNSALRARVADLEAENAGIRADLAALKDQVQEIVRGLGDSR